MVLLRRAVPLLASLCFQTALTALIGGFAISLTLNEFQSFEFCLAAVAADLLSLIFLAWAVIWGLWKSETPLRNLLDQKKGLAGLAILPLLAYVVTLVFLLMMQFQDETVKGDKSLLGNRVYGLLDAAWTTFCASVLASVILLVLCCLDKPPAPSQSDSLPRYTLGRSSAALSLSAPSFNGAGITIPPHSPYQQSGAPSSVFSDTYEPYNMATPHCVRTVTSRTRLASSSSVAEFDQATSSSPEHDSYELTPLSSPVSAASPIDGKPRITSNNLSAKRLETIPGSTSNSPAKPLEWPFNEDMAEGKKRTSAKDMETSPSKKAGREKKSPIKTPSKAVLDESHIHPLFRSDSPGPPPVPSPTTNVLASEHGGKYISKETLGRIRAHSNASSATSLSPPARPERYGHEKIDIAKALKVLGAP